MASAVGRARFESVSYRTGFYAPDLLPRLQAVLADLADLDFAYEKSLDTVRQSSEDEGRKSAMIASLRHEHRERRAPYVRELTALKEQIEATFA